MDIKQMTVRDVKALIDQGDVDEHTIALLREDSRTGVQKVIKQYDKRVELEKQKYQQFQDMRAYEQAGWSRGYRYIAGVDEVGRGPLAGPVVAASVVLDPDDESLVGINDSKQLSESQRKAFYDTIIERAIAVGVGVVEAETIDKINIYQSAKQAMQQAVDHMATQPDYCLIDAMTLEELMCPQQSLIKGDQKSISIAAASVIAKVTRDRLMIEAAHTYPDFEFERNMGYGTPNHLQALAKHGPTKIHRLSFNPVSSYR
ncbi:ribonuclease HII [Alkalibacillus flavidus]|uniref:Ribonuclease HII n=1 Tax=Alkalibacillus flavidus TaxID=546021 RepID=A0ABV2KRA8_9BACI